MHEQESIHPRYRIERSLGEGGAGTVYLARDLVRRQRLVTLKLSKRDRTSHAALNEYFTLRELSHPGIPKALDTDLLPGTSRRFIALENIEGSTFDQLAAEFRTAYGNGDRSKLLSIFLQSAQILEYVHGRGWLHLDVKPSNLIAARNRICLIDFSSALRREQSTGDSGTPPNEGSVGFVAPELLEGGIVDQRADLYSLGASLYFVLTGARPVPGSTNGEILAQHPEFPKRPDGVDEPLARVIAKLLSRSPEQRFENARDLIDALQTLSGSDESKLRSHSLGALEFSGRQKELACFFDWVEQLESSDCSRVLHLTGEPGIGKTRLLEVMETELVRLGWYVLLGSAREGCVSTWLSESLKILGTEDSSTFDEKTIILVDDASWLSPGALEFLNHCERPYVLAGSLADSLDLRETTDCPLSRLDAKAARTAIEKSGAQLRPLRIDQIVQESAGNPDRITLLIRNAINSATGTPPEEIIESFRAQYENLPDAAKQLALHLSLVKQPISDDLLQQIIEINSDEWLSARYMLADLNWLSSTKNEHRLQSGLSACFDLWTDKQEQALAHSRLARFFQELEGPGVNATYHSLSSDDFEKGRLLAENLLPGLKGADDFEHALRICYQGLNAAKHHDDAAFFLEALGDQLARVGHLDEAGASYDRLLIEYHLEPQKRFRILRKRGGVDQRGGQTQSARAAFEEALGLLDSSEESQEHLFLFHEIASLYLFLGDFSRSTTFINRGLEVLEGSNFSHEDQTLHALNFHSLRGNILLRQFHYSEAAQAFLQGLEHANQSDSTSNSALILNNLGIAYHQANQIDEALEVYDRAQALAQSNGDSAALFSIRCNLAGVHARLGRFADSDEMLESARHMALADDSRRAQLFLLHTIGLVSRLKLADGDTVWRTSTLHADELGDPLLSAYGRTYWAENEIFHGRWKSARKILHDLHSSESNDPRLERAIVARSAWLDALCGESESADRMLAIHFPKAVRQKPDFSQSSYGELWDFVIAAKVLAELGELSQSETWAERLEAEFEKSGQHPAVIECRLLRLDIALRHREPKRARKILETVERLVGKERELEDARGLSLRLPLLRARFLRLTSKRVKASELLEKTAQNATRDSNAEETWLAHLVAFDDAESPNVQSSLQRFAEELDADDAANYLRRDHAARLGIREPSRQAGRSEEVELSPSIATLERIAAARSNEEVLELLVRACGAQGAVIWLAGQGQALAETGAIEDRDQILSLLHDERDSGFTSGGYFARFGRFGRSDNKVAGIVFVRTKTDVDRDDIGISGFLRITSKLIAMNLLSTQTAEATTLPAAARHFDTTHTLESSRFAGGVDPAIRELLTVIDKTSESKLPVLISGEPGTGKDQLARWIHSSSPLAPKPFVHVDCSASSLQTLDAELFGRESSTRADGLNSTTGAVEIAHQGTIYLDNIDATSPEIQAKLLRLLQDGVFRPLGGGRKIKVQVRVVSSSQQNLKELTARGLFRNDLYFRLSGICLELPALRHRKDDLLPLIQHFQAASSTAPHEYDSSALAALRKYSWPGNVRELETVVRRLELTSESPVDGAAVTQALGSAHHGANTANTIPATEDFEGKSYKEALDEVKRRYLTYLFQTKDGNVSAMARELGTTKRNVYLKMAQLDLDISELRSDSN